MRKEIYATLQVADHEIRILVGELHNGRLYILKVERVPHTSIVNNEIVSQTSIVEAIKKALANIEKNVKIKVTRVLLVVPSFNLQRINRSLHVDINDPLNRILKDNIEKLYRLALNQKSVENMELINAEIYRYKVNGVHVYKVPLNEKAGRLFAETDLYYVNRNIVYQLASIVEQSGLEILDVCVDQIAVGKEASLYDVNNEEYIVAIQVERQASTLGLFYKGRLIHSEVITVSLEKWIQKIVKMFEIPYEVAVKLMFNNVDLNAKVIHTDPICLWSKDKKNYTCSQQDLMDVVGDDINVFIETIKEACQDIISTNQVRFVLVGEGSMVKGISHRLTKELNCQVDNYLPSTLGARDGSLVAMLGTFYNHIDHRNWQVYKQDSVDEHKDLEVSQNKQEENNITKRLKTIFNQNK